MAIIIKRLNFYAENNTVVDIIGAPFDLAGPERGARLGPTALRLAGLHEIFRFHGIEYKDHGDLSISLEKKDPEKSLNGYTCGLPAYKKITKAVNDSIRRERTPLVLGGDHSISIGSISAALRFYKSDLAVLWIDAHADLNTPQSSPSGNLHGMPLAALMGFPSGKRGIEHEQWKAIQEKVIGSDFIKREHMAWVGLNDVDPTEIEAVDSMPEAFTISTHSLEKLGMAEVMNKFSQWMFRSNCKHIWVSFDIDCLDTSIAVR